MPMTVTIVASLDCLDGVDRSYPLPRSSLFSSYFTKEEVAQHRAKAYLLLVEAAGDEFARREYNPETLAKQIKYIEAGGSLRVPYTRAEIQAKITERLRLQQENKESEEVQGK